MREDTTVMRPSDDEVSPLGWHVIEGGHLLEMLRRANEGENADLLFAELWANAEHQRVEGSE